MTDYVKSVNYASKDALATGEALKIVSGTEINTEFDRIVTAIGTKFDPTDKDVNDGLCPLDGSSVVPAGNLPAASTTLAGIAELATIAEAVTGTDTGRTITPDALQGVLDNAGGLLQDIKILVDPNADTILGWDDSQSKAISYAIGEGIRSDNITLKADINGLAAQGGISATNDLLMMWDASASLLKKVTIEDALASGGGTVPSSRD